MENKITVLVDIDGVVADLASLIVKRYNEKYGESLKYSDLITYDTKSIMTKCVKDPFVELKTPEDMGNLDLIVGAKESLDELNELVNLKVCTALQPANVLPRHEWLKKNFAWYKSHQLITCVDKHMIKGDILIDDCFEKHSEDRGLSILFAQPWNECYKEDMPDNMIRTGDWSRIVRIIKDYIAYANYKK